MRGYPYHICIKTCIRIYYMYENTYYTCTHVHNICTYFRLCGCDICLFADARGTWGIERLNGWLSRVCVCVFVGGGWGGVKQDMDKEQAREEADEERERERELLKLQVRIYICICIYIYTCTCIYVHMYVYRHKK